MRRAHTAGRLARAAAPVLLAALECARAATAATFQETPARLVILPARADGAALRLLLDTGDSGGLSIDAAAARRLGLAVRPSTAAAGDRRGLFGALSEPIGTLRVERLEVDDAVWGAIEATVTREDAALQAAVGAPYDGVIGAGLLAGRCLVVDYPRGTLAFETGEARDAALGHGRGAALRYVAGHLVTDVNLGTGTRAALIDTASAASFVDVSLAGPTGPEAPRTRGLVDAAGTTAGLPQARIARLSAGGTILRGVTALALDLAGLSVDPDAGEPPAALFGADVLARHRVVLDLAHGRFALETGRR